MSLSMRFPIAFFALLFCTKLCFAQYVWPKLSDSLIHSQKSLSALTRKVDLLHKDFEKYHPKKVILSAQQGYGRYFRAYNAVFSLDSLKSDLTRGLSYPQLFKKYPSIEWVLDSVLVYRFEDTDWQGNKRQVFAEAPYLLKHGHDPQNWVHPNATASNFVLETYSNGNSGEGFLFYDRLSQQPLPGDAARLLQYVDFVIGNASLLIGDFYPYHVNDFILPCFPLQKQFDLLSRQPLNWSCGNDPAPRFHILKTAQRAAELGNLPVFLQSHFMIVNDC